MNIEGTYTLQAPPEEVWQCLMDQKILRTTIPGVEKVERIEKDTYEISIHLAYASLKGSYHGQVTLSEQQYPYHYRLTVEGEGRQSTFNGSGSVHLNGRENTTVIAYKGTLTTSKLSALLPQSLVKGATKLFIQQYFLALAERLLNSSRVHTIDAQAEEVGGLEGADGVKPANADIVIPPPAAAQEKGAEEGTRTIYAKIAYLLRLGAGDPEQEVEWEQRLRRISTISGLLFLVWLGTRIPRRRR